MKYSVFYTFCQHFPNTIQQVTPVLSVLRDKKFDENTRSQWFPFVYGCTNCSYVHCVYTPIQLLARLVSFWFINVFDVNVLT